MEGQTITFILLSVIVLVLALRTVLMALNAPKTKQLKVIKSQFEAVQLNQQNDALLRKSLKLLAQSEMFDEIQPDMTEEELLRTAVSFRLERRASLKQLKSSGLVDTNLAKNRLVNN